MSTPLRVLIAEDRPTDAELMVYELRRSGFQPNWKRVETEEAYLAELQTAPEVILADHTLPQFGAPRALELLKKTGLDIPLIVVTGSISEEVAVERIKQGAADYILKDRMTRLGEAVKRALEEKRLRQEKQKADAALQARYQELQTLHKLSQDVLNTLDLQTAVNQILDQAMSVDSFDIGTILLVDPSGKKIEAAAARGYRDPANLQRQPSEVAPGRSQYRALSYEKTYVVENVAEADGLRTLKKEGIQSAILTPVRAGERTLGFIQVGSRTRRKFDPDKIRLLEAIGNQMGVAIQKARLFEETQRNLERIKALHEIDKAISSTLDLNATLVVLQRIIPKFVPSITASTVRLMDKESGRLDAASCWNLNEDEWRAHVKTGRMTLADKVFESQRPLKILNVERDPAHPADFARKYGLTSYLGVPLSAKEERLGVLGFYTREEHDFSEGDVEFLVTLAGQAAIAIHNSQLYEETKKQAIELEKSNKVKDEFLSVMSHELRTPLNVVMGYTGMIQERMLGEINEKQTEACEKIISRTHDLLSIVNSILYTTSLETNTVKVDRHEADLGDFLSDLKSSFVTSLEKDLDLIWDYPSDLPTITTDAAKLKHVLLNLINNAIKFTEKGSVTISAKISQKAAANGQRSSVEFQVADTGIGIAKENLPIIFDKFKQIDSSETRLFGGVGLGLYIAKEFTALIGGKIEVESEPGKGSTFTVTIPYEN